MCSVGGGSREPQLTHAAGLSLESRETRDQEAEASKQPRCFLASTTCVCPAGPGCGRTACPLSLVLPLGAGSLRGNPGFYPLESTWAACSGMRTGVVYLIFGPSLMGYLGPNVNIKHKEKEGVAWRVLNRLSVLRPFSVQFFV